MLEFESVTKQLGTQIVIDQVSFRVNTGERVGVVGPNGAGKSTLFALIQGSMETDGGKILMPKNTRLGHLRQQLNAYAVDETVLDYTADCMPELADLHHEIHRVEHRISEEEGGERDRLLQRLGTLQEEYEHLGGYEMINRAEAALSGLGFPVDKLQDPFTSFSGGWQMRAELARTLIAKPDILLLDEPSNYLDLPAVEWLQRYLREFTGTMLLISHDRFLLESLTQVTMEVMAGGVNRYQGGYAYYVETREARYEQLLAAKKNQDRKREQLERFVERFRAKATKAKQAQSRMKMLDRMEVIEVPEGGPTQSPIQIPDPPRCGAEVFRCEDLAFRYDETRWILRDVNLRVERGEKIALVGYNGMGKTTLLRVLAGALQPSEGKRIPGHDVVIGYQSQDFAETMPPEQTVFNIVQAAAKDAHPTRVRNILGGFGFGGDHIDKPCRVLSGGEKIRLAFARIFVNPPNLLLLDEPTTHLDLVGRETLEQALLDYTGTVVLVSHDITFVRRVANAVFAVTPGQVTRFHGGYEYYREKASELVLDAPAAPKPGKAVKRARAAERKEQQKRKRELEKKAREAEARVTKLEMERDELMEGLAQEGADYQALNRRLQKVQEAIYVATNKWEEASLAAEDLEEG